MVLLKQKRHRCRSAPHIQKSPKKIPTHTEHSRDNNAHSIATTPLSLTAGHTMGIAKDASSPPESSSPPTITLTEDEIDDLLYIARSNDLPSLEPYLTHLAQQHAAPASAILAAATDPASHNTALHYAAANGHAALARALLAAFADAPARRAAFANARNAAGSAPLHWAALNGQLEAVQVLVGAGAAPALGNGAGHDAVFEAERAGRAEVVEWLLREGEGLEVGVGGGSVEEGEGEEVEEEDGKGEGGVMGIGESSRMADDGVEMEVDGS